jgi:hypothetical protein
MLQGLPFQGITTLTKAKVSHDFVPIVSGQPIRVHLPQEGLQLGRTILVLDKLDRMFNFQVNKPELVLFDSKPNNLWL